MLSRGLLAVILTACIGGVSETNPRPQPGTPSGWSSQRLEGRLLGFDGRHLFLAERDGSHLVRLPVPIPNGPLELTVAGSVGANQLAVLTEDAGATIHLFDLASGQTAVVPLHTPGPARGLIWATDGRVLAWGAANTIGMIPLGAPRSADLLRGVPVSAVLGVTPERQVVYRSDDNVWLVESGTPSRLITTGLADGTYSSPLGPDGRFLIVSRCTALCEGTDGRGPDFASVYDAFALDRTTGGIRQVTYRRPVAGLPGRGAPLGWLPGGRRLLWTVHAYADQPALPDEIFRVDAASGEVVRLFSSLDLYSLRASADGSAVYMHTICCARLTRPAGFYAVDLATRKVNALALPNDQALKILAVF